MMRRLYTPTCRPTVPGSTALRQAGFSLIELMIAIAMGLFLVIGIIGLVISFSSTFRTQDKLTQGQESLRFMLSVLDTTVHNAGYYADPVTDTVATALPAASVGTFAAAQFISGTTDSTTAIDTLNVRYQTAGNDTLMNCQGDASTTKVVLTNSFTVNTSGQFTCAVATEKGSLGTPLVLADNVASMTVMYGVDTDSDGSADTYMTAAAVTTSSMWLKVLSVRLTLKMKDLVSSTSTTTAYLKPITHTISLLNK
jgi:type IV pilus assembly protein PilW